MAVRGYNNTIAELLHILKINYCLGAIADSGGRWKGKGEIDEGLKLGDYPVLPWKSAQLNAPRGWWDNQDRRNKEDPVSEAGKKKNNVGTRLDVLRVCVCRYTKRRMLSVCGCMMQLKTTASIHG